MKITTEEVMSCVPCPAYPRSRVEQLCGKGITAAHVLRLDIPARDKRWVLTNILARRDREALIAWVWRCLALIDRDCPRWQAMLAAPGDVELARAAAAYNSADAIRCAYAAHNAAHCAYAAHHAASCARDAIDAIDARDAIDAANSACCASAITTATAVAAIVADTADVYTDIAQIIDDWGNR